MKRTPSAAVGLLVLVACATAAAKVTLETPPEWKKTHREPANVTRVDPALPDYRRVAKLSGTVRSEGSSGLSNLLQRWAQEFKSIYPGGVEVVITGTGSDAALPALLAGRADLAPMSRPMRPEELAEFEAKFGYPPTRVSIAADALAIYVNKYNPLERATLAQLDRIYSMTRKHGGEPIRTWGQMGLSGGWEDRPIEIKGPDRSQGSYALFRDLVLNGGDYRFDLKPEPVSTSIVQAVGAEATAIGFASRFYATHRARALALSPAEGQPGVLPTQENCLNGKYPLARFLYIYVNRKPGVPLPAATGELLGFICSKQGQEIVAHENNLPLDATTAKRDCLSQVQ